MENNTNQSAVVGLKIENGGEVFSDYENNTASGRNSHAEGEDTEASAIAAHSEGSESKAMQIAAHAEGYSFAAGHGSHAENGSVAEGDYSHSEGYLTKTMSANAHSENAYTIAAAQSSHAEGDLTLTEGADSHSEGESTETTGNKSHAEGKQTKAGGDGSHAEGEATEAIGADSHAEGKNTCAVGARSFAGGNSTVAAADNQTVIGTFNLNRTDTLFEIGNGASDTERSNAFEVYSDGSIAIGGETVTPAQLQSLIDMLPALGTGSATALWLQAGKPILDTVESGSDERWFEFVPSETGKHVIYSEGNINIKATLFDSELTPLASDNSGGWGYNFRIYANLTCGEKYYICVQSETGSTGSYYMNVNALSAMEAGATSEAAATITEFKKGIRQEYNNSTNQIWHKFTANAAEAHVDGGVGTYYVSANRSDILSLTLYDSEMNLVCRNNEVMGGNTCFIERELNYNEIYYLCSEVSYLSAEHIISVSYRKQDIYCGSNMNNPIEIPCIYLPVITTISTPGEEKWYKLTVDGYCDRIIVHSIESEIELRAELYNYDNQLICSDTEEDSNPNFKMEPEVTPFYTYYLKVTGKDNATGSFKVRWTDEVFIQNISFEEEVYEIPEGEYETIVPVLEPADTTDTWIDWKSDDESVATVSQNGEIRAISAGMATITATAGSYPPVSKSVFVRVFVPTERVLMPEEVTLDIGQTYTFATVPEDATSQNVVWEIEDPDDVMDFNPVTCTITALKAGIATITAKPERGIESSCTIWVRGKTPVFLLHGRWDHSKTAWGIINDVNYDTNNEFDADINATNTEGKLYVDPANQEIKSILGSTGDDENPCYLGKELETAGYNKNVDLFVFNYPNKDAVVHSAKKFSKYIENLIANVRNSESNQIKTSFFASKSAFDSNVYKLNIVGHSMGGLIARYYIENMNKHIHVDKLITVCTPHWGSDYAYIANLVGGEDLHFICDHDLDPKSAMYGGNNSITLNCNAIFKNCYNEEYTLTDSLQHNIDRHTKYYAFAGLDYTAYKIDANDYPLEISTPSSFNTYQKIIEFMRENDIYKYLHKEGVNMDINIQTEGDNIVPFLSQIGWTESTEKRISLEKIFISIDSNGGNSASNSLHTKMTHRKSVCAKIIEYLED